MSSGVANTVAFRHEGNTIVRAGANTDVQGLVRPVETLGHLPGEATILGGGATAASALTAAVRLGASLVRVFVRDTAKTHPLVDLAVRLGGDARGPPARRTHRHPPRVRPVDAAGRRRRRVGRPAVGTRRRPVRRRLRTVADRGRQPLDRGRGLVLNGLDMLTEQAIGQIRFFLTGDEDELLPDEAGVRRAMRTAVDLPAVISG
ncbi:hypothetical protein Q9Q99_16270 [Curtobacterium flaccumfaciens]|nr:hypothetical protein Q9Q99_16270 [Curtobacterium flaccumfaciens]